MPWQRPPAPGSLFAPSSTFTTGGASSLHDAGQPHNQLSYPSWQGSRTGDYGVSTSPYAVSSDFSPYGGDHLPTLSSITPSRDYDVGFDPYSYTGSSTFGDPYDHSRSASDASVVTIAPSSDASNPYEHWERPRRKKSVSFAEGSGSSLASGSTGIFGSSTNRSDSLKTDTTASRTSGVESSAPPAPGILSRIVSSLPSLPSLPSIWSSSPPTTAPSLGPPARKDPSSQYTWTTTANSSSPVRTIISDNRQNRPERRSGALRGVLRRSGASTTVPDLDAEYTKEKSESLQIRAGSKCAIGTGTRKHGKSVLNRINQEWFKTYWQTSGKSTRLSFGDGTTDDRQSTRQWRAEKHLDPSLGSRVEASSIGAYQSRVLRSAAKEARKGGMDSTEATAHLLSTLASLSGTTYMLEREVEKDYFCRGHFESTAEAQSAYASEIKSTEADGRNTEYKPFLRFMRGTDTMLDDGVVQVKRRDHREENDWTDKKAVGTALSKYMSVYSGKSTGMSSKRYTNSKRYQSGKSHKRLHDRRTRRDSDSE